MKEINFEESMKQLETIANDLEKGDLSLEESVEKFEEGIKLSKVQSYVDSNYAYFPVIFDRYKYTRNEVYKMLAENDIVARKYFYPLTNSFECYRNYPTAGTEKTPKAQHIAVRVLTLPLYADLDINDVDKICNLILG